MTRVPVAVVQICSTGDRAKNLARVEELAGEAVSRGAKLLALPENVSFLPERESEKLARVEDPEQGETVRLLRALAVRHRVAIVGGSLPLPAAAPGKVRNACLVFAPTGAIVARYDKLHLFDVALDAAHTFTESSAVEAGQEVVTADVLGLRLGLSICYDLRFPELYRALVRRGAGVFTVPAAFTRETGRDHWELLLRARAVENLCYVIAPAQWGQHNARRVSFGRSSIVDPWGQVLAQVPDGEGVALAEIDIDRLASCRARLPCLEHLRPPLLPPDPGAG